MRDISTVIQTVLLFIPVEFKEVRKNLEKVKYDSMYTAPECIGNLWAEASHYLAELPYDEDLIKCQGWTWLKTVKTIWTNQN